MLPKSTVTKHSIHCIWSTHTFINTVMRWPNRSRMLWLCSWLITYDHHLRRVAIWRWLPPANPQQNQRPVNRLAYNCTGYNHFNTQPDQKTYVSIRIVVGWMRVHILPIIPTLSAPKCTTNDRPIILWSLNAPLLTCVATRRKRTAGGTAPHRFRGQRHSAGTRASVCFFGFSFSVRLNGSARRPHGIFLVRAKRGQFKRADRATGYTRTGVCNRAQRECNLGTWAVCCMIMKSLRGVAFVCARVCVDFIR